MSQSSSNSSTRYKRRVNPNISTISFNTSPNTNRRRRNINTAKSKYSPNNTSLHTIPPSQPIHNRQVLTIHRQHPMPHTHPNPNIPHNPPIQSIITRPYPRTRNRRNPTHKPPNITTATFATMSMINGDRQQKPHISLIPDSNETVMAVSDETFRQLMQKQRRPTPKRNSNNGNPGMSRNYRTSNTHNRCVVLHTNNTRRKRKRTALQQIQMHMRQHSSNTHTHDRHNRFITMQSIANTNTNNTNVKESISPPHDMVRTQSDTKVKSEPKPTIMSIASEMLGNTDDFEIDCDNNWDVGVIDYSNDDYNISNDNVMEEGEIHVMEEGEVIDPPIIDDSNGQRRKRRKLNPNESEPNLNDNEQKSNGKSDEQIMESITNPSLVPYTPSSEENGSENGKVPKESEKRANVIENLKKLNIGTAKGKEVEKMDKMGSPHLSDVSVPSAQFKSDKKKIKFTISHKNKPITGNVLQNEMKTNKNIEMKSNKDTREQKSQSNTKESKAKSVKKYEKYHRSHSHSHSSHSSKSERESRPRRKRESKYDSEGRLLKKEAKYDSEGRLIKAVKKYDSEGRLVKKETKYDNEGRLIKAKPKPKPKPKAKYDSEGRLIKSNIIFDFKSDRYRKEKLKERQRSKYGKTSFDINNHRSAKDEQKTNRIDTTVTKEAKIETKPVITHNERTFSVSPSPEMVMNTSMDSAVDTDDKKTNSTKQLLHIEPPLQTRGFSQSPLARHKRERTPPPKEIRPSKGLSKSYSTQIGRNPRKDRRDRETTDVRKEKDSDKYRRRGRRDRSSDRHKSKDRERDLSKEKCKESMDKTKDVNTDQNKDKNVKKDKQSLKSRSNSPKKRSKSRSRSRDRDRRKDRSHRDRDRSKERKKDRHRRQRRSLSKNRETRERKQSKDDRDTLEDKVKKEIHSEILRDKALRDKHRKPDRDRERPKPTHTHHIHRERKPKAPKAVPKSTPTTREIEGSPGDIDSTLKKTERLARLKAWKASTENPSKSATNSPKSASVDMEIDSDNDSHSALPISAPNARMRPPHLPPPPHMLPPPHLPRMSIAPPPIHYGQAPHTYAHTHMHQTPMAPRPMHPRQPGSGTNTQAHIYGDLVPTQTTQTQRETGHIDEEDWGAPPDEHTHENAQKRKQKRMERSVSVSDSRSRSVSSERRTKSVSSASSVTSFSSYSRSSDSDSYSRSRSPSHSRHKREANNNSNNLDNPLMDIIIKSAKSKNKSLRNRRRGGTKEKRKSSDANNGYLKGLAPVPCGKEVYSGNTRIGGLFARYKHKKMCENNAHTLGNRNKTFALKIGSAKYSPLLQVWGQTYLKQSMRDQRRNRQIYKEMPATMVRWLDAKEMSMAQNRTANRNRTPNSKSDMKLRNYLRNQLSFILKSGADLALFNEEQKLKILESSYKKVLKAYKQINEKQINECDKQTLSQFIDNMQSKINDLVNKYVIQYKKRNLQNV